MILFFAQLAWALQAPQDADPRNWDLFYKSCEDFLVPQFHDRVGEWKAWQVQANHTAGELITFTEKTCPEYYKSKQGDDTLPAFVAELNRVRNLAVDTGTKGRPISDFLDERYKTFAADSARVGVPFAGDRCGTIFNERRTHMAQELNYLQQLVLTSEKSCSGKFDTTAAKTVQQKQTKVENKAQAARKPVNGGTSRAPASTITGTIKPQK